MRRAGTSRTLRLSTACFLAALSAAAPARALAESEASEIELSESVEQDGTQASSAADAGGVERTDSFDGPDEPLGRLRQVEQRNKEIDSLFPVSPLGWLHDTTERAKNSLYDATGLNLVLVFAHLFQGMTDSIGGEDDIGTATTMDFLGAWDLFHKGRSTQAQAVFHVQSRWDYGSTGPEDLGAASLGSAIGTADTYAESRDTFILRNLYWRQGTPETGWVYRLGKITPDAILSSSPHLDSQTTFLPSAGTGPFAIALPDSGLGAVGAWYINDRVALAGLISDANGDRTDFGDLGEGDLFEALELHVKIAPRTPKAPYSKLTLWHTDGTKNGEPMNAEFGPDGWGFFLMHQQELTADGRLIGIARYGHGFDDAAVFDDLAAVHLLFYEPRLLTRLKHDVVGAAFNWGNTPVDGARDEYNVEVFYRFPLFPNVDTTFSYQSVINPAFTRDVDHASVFSMRLRTAF